MTKSVVDLSELQKALAYIEYVNGLRIQDMVFIRDGLDVPPLYTEEEAEDWKFVGLSNVCFINTVF